MLTSQQTKVLLSCFLFANTSPPGELFLASLSAVNFSAGAEIYTTSSFRRSIGVLTHGNAVVTGLSGVVLNSFVAGDCFGAAAIFGGGEEYVSTVKAKPRCDVIFISAERLEELFRQRGDIALNYIAFLSNRIRFLNLKIEGFTLPSAASALRMWLERNENCGEVVPSGGLAALARQLNIGRASLYRALSELEAAGEIAREGKVITLLNKTKNLKGN